MKESKMTGESLPIHAKREIPQTVPSRVVFNRIVGPGWYLLRMEESSIASTSEPGQFVQILCSDPGSSDPLLRRPFSVYDVDTSAGTYDILYIVTGRGTHWMAHLPENGSLPGGENVYVDTIGPFGNRFTLPTQNSAGKFVGDPLVILVAGGVGVAPLYFFARELCALKNSPDITLCMGARSSSQLQGIEDFRRLPINSEVSTNDGSEGHHGFVTDLLAKNLDTRLKDVDPKRIHIYGCGPTAMNESLRKLTVERALRCEICLESHMACAFGICFACVVPIAKTVGGELFNRRICLEGPVFDARLIGEGLGVL